MAPVLQSTTYMPGPIVGEPAPDFTAIDSDGKQIQLSDFLGTTVVLETGSRNCPIFTMVMGRMNDLARQFPTITPITLYVRHTRLSRALLSQRDGQEFRDCVENARWNLSHDNRTLVIDHMADPASHQMYETAPNMLYIIDRHGTLVYSSDWMLREFYAPHEVEQVIGALEGENQARETPDPSFPFPRLKAFVRQGWQTFWQDDAWGRSKPQVTGTTLHPPSTQRVRPDASVNTGVETPMTSQWTP